MAKQKGVIKLEGSIGDISFYKGRDGNFMARTKGGISGDRIKNDPAFERTRENGQEFGKAGKAGKLVRAAFREVIKTNKDSRMSNRLTQEMMKVIQADTTNLRGERVVLPDHIRLIKGFDFNETAKLSTVMSLPFTLTVNRAEGSISLVLPAFVPANSIVTPGGATHARLVLGASEMDFDAESYVTTSAQSSMVPISGEEQAQVTLECGITEAGTLPLLVVLGVEFYQEVNGQQYPLKNGTYNALSIVETNLPAR
ncbi:MAG: hypothetical protein A2W90_01670 [Bacteroidetes bacterium GWF2_42_66]|nr:MAG: hypothetical protein A2W92_11975 [Bacteroidetes bacterium GWA2_42_15]OFY01388.1 MAG: hypothetical protein A2W89_15155 [Bacteroidetes bacterium GWE2_42_39]OFY42230.1 MAG: hypothetical protein A2W90_01670 [Bacteroidetes bacterium GWF2_42_66]HBL77899.1 hypothetical protein [Prolixibacteraceae bacterium]HCU63380.1 hypothetical protein [Prolixibacteraceae bacterium]